MGERPGTWEVVNWYLSTPLVKQWGLISEDSRERILAFWLRASERDAWTFRQLQELLDSLIDEGEIPALLQAWAIDVAAGRRRVPVRTGPKGNRSADFKMALEAMFRHELGQESLRGVYREIGERANRSPEAVESAVKRGRQWPPGA